MFNRGTLFVVVVVAAIGIPYVMSNGNPKLEGGFTRWWSSMFTTSDASPVASATPIPGLGNRFLGKHNSITSNRYAHPSHSATKKSSESDPWIPTVNNVADLFRFDITPTWVLENWPRVSSQLSDFEYTSLRVPLITGTGLHDLAGSMTYSFNGDQELQRILFHGSTGDPNPLVELATRYFGMVPEAALGGRCYVRRDGKEDNIIGILRIRHATVAKKDRPRLRYRVLMEVNRIGKQSHLSSSVARMLKNDEKVMSFGNRDSE